MLNDELVRQFVYVYENYENWHTKKLPKEEAEKYHKALLQKGRLLYYTDTRGLAGYVESWRLTFDQLGRIICHEPFFPIQEDINTGDICYLANIWIRPDRRNDIIKTLKLMFFRQNYICKYFIGHALRKKTQPIKVFTRKQFYDKYARS
jgi:hypothetical protein